MRKNESEIFGSIGFTIQFSTTNKIREEVAITLSPIRSETTCVGYMLKS